MDRDDPPGCQGKHAALQILPNFIALPLNLSFCLTGHFPRKSTSAPAHFIFCDTHHNFEKNLKTCRASTHPTRLLTARACFTLPIASRLLVTRFARAVSRSKHGGASAAIKDLLYDRNENRQMARQPVKLAKKRAWPCKCHTPKMVLSHVVL